MFPNGSVELSTRNGVTTTLDFDDVCVAFRRVSSDGKRLLDEAFRFCPKTKDEEALDLLYTLTYPICCTISNVFLILTFATYAIVPELRYEAVMAQWVISFFQEDKELELIKNIYYLFKHN